MKNPYESPRSRSTKKSRLFYVGVALLVIAFLMPILGLAGTIFGMMQSFDELSQSDQASPDGLATGISTAFSMTTFGAVIGVIAAILGGILIGLARHRDSNDPTVSENA